MLAIEHFARELVLPSDSWLKTSRVDALEVCKLGIRTPSDQDVNSAEPVIMLTVQVAEGGTWCISVHGKRINPESCTLLSKFPTSLPPDCFNNLLLELDKLSVCPGNPDKHFVDIVQSKTEQKSGEMV